MASLRKLKMYQGVGSSLDAALRVVDIDFDLQCTGGGINRIRIADDRALEGLAGEFIESESSLYSGSMWNNSCGTPPAPALISAPTSVFRAVITPEKGA